MAEARSVPTRRALPLILIRGFGGIGVEDEKRVTYQGFNDGTVYPGKRGENYIYEGLILRFMKSNWQYQDATNVVGYYSKTVEVSTDKVPAPLKDFDKGYFTGDRIIIDAAMALNLVQSAAEPCTTLWVFRYYDLDDRKFETYGKALVRLVGFIRDLAAIKRPEEPKPKVNIIAHSMGGLLVREAVQVTYPGLSSVPRITSTRSSPWARPTRASRSSSSRTGSSSTPSTSSSTSTRSSRPIRITKPRSTTSRNHFPLDRLLTVVGTNYRTYSVGPASWLNRLFSVSGEGGPTYNRSDGLVKQKFAQIPGAVRTFVHKCHGGPDSLVTSREAYEIATRFFFGNVRARLRLLTANVKRGGDWFGKSEFFFGVSIKPRKVDFDLFHQSAEAENCYGPFAKYDLSDEDEKVDFPWADPATS